MVLYAIALPALVGALAMSANLAVMYTNWQALQKATDSAALAGATRYETATINGDQGSPTIHLGAASGVITTSVPDSAAPGSYLAQVVSSNLLNNVPDPNGPNTGSFFPVLIR
jgi:Flp pilus assembly protein TadG